MTLYDPEKAGAASYWLVLHAKRGSPRVRESVREAAAPSRAATPLGGASGQNHVRAGRRRHDRDGGMGESLLDGAEFGSWVRKDYRGTVKSLLFIRKCYRTSFETFPVLVGITRQPELHELHLALGYEYVGEIEDLFDHAPARAYKLRRENFNVGRRKQVIGKRQQHDQQPAGEYPEPIREIGTADSEAAQQPDRGGSENGRGERGDSDSKPLPRRRKKRFSTSYQNTQQSLARSGFGKSTAGQQILSDLGMKGGQDIAQIPTNAASQFIGMAPSQEGMGIGALGTAAAYNNTRSGNFNSSQNSWGFDPASLLQGGGTAALAYEGW